MSNWRAQAEEKFSEFLKLEKNWNSYEAGPIDPRATAAAMDLLTQVLSDSSPLPSLVPTNCGGVGIEWYGTHKHELEVEVYGDGTFGVVYSVEAAPAELVLEMVRKVLA